MSAVAGLSLLRRTAFMEKLQHGACRRQVVVVGDAGLLVEVMWSTVIAVLVAASLALADIAAVTILVIFPLATTARGP